MKCHRGHENPPGLWNCPTCTDPVLDAARRLIEAVPDDVHEILARSYDPEGDRDVMPFFDDLANALAGNPPTAEQRLEQRRRIDPECHP